MLYSKASSLCLSQVFAPLARLLGLYGIKEELEELGFRYSKPHKYATLRRHLNHLADEYEPVIQQVAPFFIFKAALVNLLVVHHNGDQHFILVLRTDSHSCIEIGYSAVSIASALPERSLVADRVLQTMAQQLHWNPASPP